MTSPKTPNPGSRSHWRVAAALAAIAAVASLLWMNSVKPATLGVLRVKGPVPAGRLLTDADVELVELPDVGGLANTVVPAQLKTSVVGHAVPRRALGAGSLLYWDDIQAGDRLGLRDGEVAQPVGLDGVHHDPELIMVGGEVLFEVVKPAAEGGAAAFARCGPFRVVKGIAPSGVVTVAVPLREGASDPAALLRQALARDPTGPRLVAVLHLESPQAREPTR
jgi:hypothetical protein